MSGKITTKGYIVEGGNSNQFLKADGSLDETTYASESQLDDINDALDNRYLKSETDDLLATKLDTADYNQHFKGVYLTESALIAAHPTAEAGDSAQVNEVGSTVVVNYSWDDEESEWVNNGSGGSGATNTDALPEGSSNLYFTTARVLATVLSGISFLANGPVISTDSILVAFGKIQKQLSQLFTSVFNLENGTTLWHPNVATSTGTVTSSGTNFTGTGTSLTGQMVGSKIFIGSESLIISTINTGAQTFTTTTALSSDVTNSAFEIKLVAQKNVSGTIRFYDANEGYERARFEPNGNWAFNSFQMRGNGQLVSDASLFTQDQVEIYGNNVKAPLLTNRQVYTVSTLPTPSSTERVYASVSDALDPATGQIVSGSGNVNCAVYWNGANWIALSGDYDSVKLTGNQTKTGILSFNNSSGSVDNAISLSNSGGAYTYSLSVANTGAGDGNFTYNTGTGTGIYTINEGSGKGIYVLNNVGSGAGVVAESFGGATGNLFVGKLSGTGDVFIVDKNGKVTTPTITTEKVVATSILEYTDNAAAITAGLSVGAFYRTGDILKIVH